MPTATWREEKSEYIIQSICRILALPDVPQTIQEELGNEALWNALKLFSDALEERTDTKETKWSPALVNLFKEQPAKCNEWLKFMAEPEFSAKNYWES